MAKSGTPRHSKPVHKPVTINLDASEVKRVDEKFTADSIPAAEPVGAASTMTKSEQVEAKPRIKSEEPKVEKPPFTAGVKPEASQTDVFSNTTNYAAAQKKSSVGSYLLAGIAGGVIALGGVFALQWANIIPTSNSGITTEKITQLEQQIADLRSNPVPAAFDDKSKAEISALQKNVQAAEIKAEAVAGTLSDLQQQFAALPKADANRQVVENQVVTNQFSKLEAALTAAQSQSEQAVSDVSGVKAQIGQLEQKLTAMQDKLSKAANQPDASTLIAANALMTAIDRGGSFKNELETYEALAPQDKSIEGLRAHTERGVPTVAKLNNWVGPVANKIMATENKLPDDAGIWDQLKASAKGLVSVRPVAGDVSGSGTGPTVARMQAALQSGDLERAVSEWEQLPAEAKAASEEFANQMKARRDAGALMQHLLANSLKPQAAAPGAQ